MHRLHILQSDITELDVDAIVNAANQGLLGGGGVDGAIHRAAGAELLEACRAIQEIRPGVRCPTGESRLTPGFALRARYVIHTVGPVWHGGDDGEPALLANCYRSALELAQDHHIRTIAFPAISCGIFGYPLDLAAALAVRTITGFLSTDLTFARVDLVAFDDDVLRALEQALEGLGSSPTAEP